MNRWRLHIQTTLGRSFALKQKMEISHYLLGGYVLEGGIFFKWEKFEHVGDLMGIVYLRERVGYIRERRNN